MQGSTSPSNSSEEKKWDEFYAAPTDDAVLVSCDKVHFRATGYRLTQASSLFAGMFATIQAPNQTTEEGVPVAFDSHTVRAFLDFVYASKPECLRATRFGFPTVATLLQMAKEYDCPILVPEIRKQFHEEASQTPSTALVWASKIDDVEAARSALQFIDGKLEEVTTRPDLFRLLLDQLRPEWRHRLIDRLLVVEPGRHTRKGRSDVPEHIGIAWDWSGIAESFDPYGTLGTGEAQSTTTLPAHPVNVDTDGDEN